MADRQEFKITLRPEPTAPGQPDPAYRLKGALKVLLRRFHFRCTRIDTIEDSKSQPPTKGTE